MQKTTQTYTISSHTLTLKPLESIDCSEQHAFAFRLIFPLLYNVYYIVDFLIVSSHFSTHKNRSKLFLITYYYFPLPLYLPHPNLNASMSTSWSNHYFSILELLCNKYATSEYFNTSQFASQIVLSRYFQSWYKNCSLGSWDTETREVPLYSCAVPHYKVFCKTKR